MKNSCHTFYFSVLTIGSVSTRVFCALSASTRPPLPITADTNLIMLLCSFRLRPPPLPIPADINLVKLSRKFNQFISKNETRKAAVVHFSF